MKKASVNRLPWPYGVAESTESGSCWLLTSSGLLASGGLHGSIHDRDGSKVKLFSNHFCDWCHITARYLKELK